MSAMPDVIVLGAGGHGLAVADALLSAGRSVRGFTDANSTRSGAEPLGIRVLGDDTVLSDLSPGECELAIGIGGIDAAGLVFRQRLQKQYESLGWAFADVRHAAATVSPGAQLGAGVQVLAGAIVQPGARAAAGVIVNTRALVEHDCVIDAFVHLAPGAIICADVHVGQGSHVGAGAVVRQGLRIGNGVTIGLGAVVTRDYAGRRPIVGIPARPLGD